MGPRWEVGRANRGTATHDWGRKAPIADQFRSVVATASGQVSGSVLAGAEAAVQTLEVWAAQLAEASGDVLLLPAAKP
eukprot:6880331-Lingulodinium_polyedra.AAC.1